MAVSVEWIKVGVWVQKGPVGSQWNCNCFNLQAVEEEYGFKEDSQWLCGSTRAENRQRMQRWCGRLMTA